MGRLVGWNPYNGWIPITGDSELIEQISSNYTIQSIDELESLLKQDSASNFSVEMSPRSTEILDSIMNVAMHRYVLKVGRPVIVRIMNAVRNAVLEWALSLEEHDIKGTSFSFSPEEKQIAQEQSVAIRIDNIGSFVGNLGSGNLAGDIEASNVEVSQIHRLIDQLRPAIHNAVFSIEEQARLKPLVESLGLEASRERPNAGVLKGVLQDIRAALAGASGNLIASGLLYEISKVLPG